MEFIVVRKFEGEVSVRVVAESLEEAKKVGVSKIDNMSDEELIKEVDTLDFVKTYVEEV